MFCLHIFKNQLGNWKGHIQKYVDKTCLYCSIYIYIYIYTYTHTHTHIHTHTHTVKFIIYTNEIVVNLNLLLSNMFIYLFNQTIIIGNGIDERSRNPKQNCFTLS